MSVLVINPDVQAAIDAALAEARKNPTDLSPEMLKTIEPLIGKFKVELKDRPLNWEDMTRSVLSVHIPIGYRANISFEKQSIGLCKHLSISVATPGNLPNEHAVKMITEAFGLSMSDHKPFKLWIEEFDPGHFAVNIVEPEIWPVA